MVTTKLTPSSAAQSFGRDSHHITTANSAPQIKATKIAQVRMTRCLR